MSSCKTKDFTPESLAKMGDEQKADIVYRSKLLNKYFEDYDELVKEETEFKKQKEEKEKAKLEKTNDAKKVEDAYKHLLEVKSKAAKEIKEAEDMYYKERNQFIEKYGSYHMTYTNNNGEESLSVSDLIDSVWEAFGNPFRLLQ